MCDPCMPDALLEAVRGLRVAEPDLGFKPLLAKLRAQQPDLGAATKEVREALAALKAESEAAKATATAPPAADESGAPSNVALSLACIGCYRLPSDMDDEREKHPICDKCRDERLPTTYICGVDCPANPGAWQLHGSFHEAQALSPRGVPLMKFYLKYHLDLPEASRQTNTSEQAAPASSLDPPRFPRYLERKRANTQRAMQASVLHAAALRARVPLTILGDCVRRRHSRRRWRARGGSRGWRRICPRKSCILGRRSRIHDIRQGWLSSRIGTVKGGYRQGLGAVKDGVACGRRSILRQRWRGLLQTTRRPWRPMGRRRQPPTPSPLSAPLSSPPVPSSSRPWDRQRR